MQGMFRGACGRELPANVLGCCDRWVCILTGLGRLGVHVAGCRKSYSRVVRVRLDILDISRRRKIVFACSHNIIRLIFQNVEVMELMARGADCM